MKDTITHHTPDALLAAYAAGSLPHPYALVVATHVSLCLECRAAYEAHQALGGVVLDAGQSAPISDGLKADVLALIELPDPAPARPRRLGPLPGPVVEALGGKPPKWSTLGKGIRQCIVSESRSGSVRLLSIPPGQAVPDHGHRGMELTLVLQGSFSDETGRFGVGDLEVADEELEHTPVADAGETCICLAATDAPLRFSALVPRLLQRLFRI
ncbi:ChrR family anti-sigma-E factor [Oceanicola sp. 502str15]|uniref:ChrR family anti-sigma-E factor n=1 Tax=Oceanicola sp. 502str15 TaxID=2696061 RepID=UPI0020963263|nr:ChrR family anti-sigma-E factor [Oceanicola sp. 502str15]MCO6384109.1 transcriptional regulator [Oceanicola sp. 502str15]